MAVRLELLMCGVDVELRVVWTLRGAQGSKALNEGVASIPLRTEA